MVGSTVNVPSLHHHSSNVRQRQARSNLTHKEQPMDDVFESLVPSHGCKWADDLLEPAAKPKTATKHSLKKAIHFKILIFPHHPTAQTHKYILFLTISDSCTDAELPGPPT